jgi:hypothetical protein
MKLLVLKFLIVHIRCYKGLIAYHKSNGIIARKKHVDTKHGALLKRYVEEICGKGKQLS